MEIESIVGRRGVDKHGNNLVVLSWFMRTTSEGRVSFCRVAFENGHEATIRRDIITLSDQLDAFDGSEPYFVCAACGYYPVKEQGDCCSNCGDV